VETTDLAVLFAGASASDPPLLVDDIATWLTAVLDETNGWTGLIDEDIYSSDTMVSAVQACTCRLVMVSAEVGLGVVPATRSGRLFRDELGALNARLAESCEEVQLLVAGIPLRLK
ncbi:MAG: bifunctional adenosylcobinamide kinase/adenosylcobinamide-phosphate guanylyltransferase, partial [Sciscionella sp.]